MSRKSEFKEPIELLLEGLHHLTLISFLLLFGFLGREWPLGVLSWECLHRNRYITSPRLGESGVGHLHGCFSGLLGLWSAEERPVVLFHIRVLASFDSFSHENPTDSLFALIFGEVHIGGTAHNIVAIVSVDAVDFAPRGRDVRLGVRGTATAVLLLLLLADLDEFPQDILVGYFGYASFGLLELVVHEGVELDRVVVDLTHLPDILIVLVVDQNILDHIEFHLFRLLIVEKLELQALVIQLDEIIVERHNVGGCPG